MLLVPGGRLASAEPVTQAAQVANALTAQAQLAFFCVTHGPNGSGGNIVYDVLIDGASVAKFTLAAGPAFFKSPRLDRALVFPQGAQVVISYTPDPGVNPPDFIKSALVVF